MEEHGAAGVQRSALSSEMAGGGGVTWSPGICQRAGMGAEGGEKQRRRRCVRSALKRRVSGDISDGETMSTVTRGIGRWKGPQKGPRTLK